LYEDERLIKSYAILDVIKFKLNEIIIKGIDNISIGLPELIDLKQKCEEMNFTTLSKVLEAFIEKVGELDKKPVPLNLKKEISVYMLQIISITRMFERVMNLESVKMTLKNDGKRF